MQLSTIEYEKKDAIAYVTLNRPDKLNAMNEQLHGELARVWADFRDDADLRVAILSGNGRCFSAGADLSGGAPESYKYTGEFPDISQTQQVYKPIIAALHSHVVGYGMWIALDADYRIATIPAAWFPKLMPWAIAAEVLLFADRISAERAYDVGMINKVVPADQLMAEAERAAHRICELSPVAVQGMKELMVRGSSLDYGAIDGITGEVQTRVMNSEDRKEGAKAFVEKRTADWPAR
jgi:enoyl-CoA hydratase/carnithine racemase